MAVYGIWDESGNAKGSGTQHIPQNSMKPQEIVDRLPNK